MADLSMTEARKRFGLLVRQAATSRQRTTITDHGQPAAVLVNVNRPGVSGDSDPWEGWSHVGEYVAAVSAGVEGAGGADGRRDPC
jgi:prevent-host-death family protein